MNPQNPGVQPRPHRRGDHSHTLHLPLEPTDAQLRPGPSTGANVGHPANLSAGACIQKQGLGACALPKPPLHFLLGPSGRSPLALGPMQETFSSQTSSEGLETLAHHPRTPQTHTSSAWPRQAWHSLPLLSPVTDQGAGRGRTGCAQEGGPGFPPADPLNCLSARPAVDTPPHHP